MTTINKCSNCGTEIDSRSEMPCPACLMKLGMQNWGSTDQPLTDIPATLDHSQGANGVDENVANIIESHFPGLEILDLLGQGGMGMVFKAKQTSLDRLVAIKVIRSDAKHREAFEVRFSREARALASLNHPNIVTVHDFGKTDDYFFLMMEFVDGVNMRDLLAGQKISPREALEIIPQVCDALQYAHDKGVVHRDIKPENILIDKNGRVKIADYGLAKLVKDESTAPSLTQTHHVMGTPHYMAPEQVEKPLSVDHRADIYSLGVVIYEMLTGELPLGRFAPPSQKVGIDVRLDRIVLQTLEKEPELRYQKASEVKTDFQSLSNKPAANFPPSENKQPNSQQSVPQSHQYVAAKHAPSNQQSVPNPYGGSPSQFESQDYRADQVGQQKPQPQPALQQQPNHTQADINAVAQKKFPAAPVPPIFAGIFSTQTYMNALYLLLSFPLGLLLFVTTMVGISAGIPLLIVWIGFFVLLGSFLVIRSLLAVERGMVRWLLGESIPFRNPVLDETTMLGKIKSILSDRSTWWGVLFAVVKFPWSILCFVLVIVFFTLPLILLVGPILFTQWWYNVEIASFEINSLERALVAAILGFPLFYIGTKITNGLAFVSRKMSRYFLSRV